MAIKKFDDIIKEIDNRVFHPIYFLMGQEPYYIDVISDYLEERVLTGAEKEFNLTVVYGKDTDVNGILSYVKRYPMMADYHLVIVKEAQNISDLDDLLPYLQRPLKSSILVICYKYKSYDRRKKLIREIEKAGVLFEGKRLYENQLPGWIGNYVRRQGYRIGPLAIQLLADHLGADLGKIINELGKVFIGLKKGEEITPLVIEEHIGISKDFNNFEFHNALGRLDAFKAFQIARYFADNPKSNPLVMTLGVLYQFFSKVLIYHTLSDKRQKNVANALSVSTNFVDQYKDAAAHFSPSGILKVLTYLRECDLKAKGVGNVSATEGELLKELTYKVLNTHKEALSAEK